MVTQAGVRPANVRVCNGLPRDYGRLLAAQCQRSLVGDEGVLVGTLGAACAAQVAVRHGAGDAVGAVIVVQVDGLLMVPAGVRQVAQRLPHTAQMRVQHSHPWRVAGLSAVV